MSDRTVVELETDAEIADAYPVLRQLRPVETDRLRELVATMRDEQGYRLFAVREDGEVRGVVGLIVTTNLYHGKHVWVHDLVVDEPHRSEGYGSRLLSFVEAFAERHDCSCYELASGRWRDEAHEFYERAGMAEYCYTFKKDLAAEAPY